MLFGRKGRQKGSGGGGSEGRISPEAIKADKKVGNFSLGLQEKVPK